LVEVGSVSSIGDLKGRAKNRKISVLEQKVHDYVCAGSRLEASSADELFNIAPDRPLALVGRAIKEYDAERYEEAVQCVNDAIHADPLCREAVLLKLRYICEFAEQGYFDFVSADAFVNHAFKNFPKDVDVLENLILVAAETFSDQKMARTFFEHGKRLDKQRFSSWDSYMKNVVERPLLYIEK
jgi:tetratricopeptide (TPR) repeat protein